MKCLIVAFALIGILASLNSVRQAQAQEAYVFYSLRADELEYRRGDEDEDLIAWTGSAFIGTDELKLRLLAQGEYDLNADSFDTLENQAVLQIPVSTFFDIKGGIRVDTPKGADRWYGVVGLAGLAPQWFEVETDFYVSETGDTSARLGGEYQLLLTNYLILTPSAEVNLAFSSDREVGVGSGFNDVELGMRLGYDLIARIFSPYVGIVYERLFGQTADFARDENEDVEGWRLAIGARLMF